MNVLQETGLSVFANEKFGEVRVIMKNGDPWFVAKDICKALDLTDVSKTVSLLDDDERGTNSIRTPSGDQQMLIISEPGMYSLVLRSRKPEAKAFKRWITHEVIPAIRKTGTYSKDSQLVIPNFSNPAEAARAWANEYEAKLEAQKQVAALEETVEIQEIALTTHRDWKTVAGIPWLREYFTSTDTRTLGKIGRLLSAICRREGIEIKNIPDDRWGEVHSYPLSAITILKETLDQNPSIFAELRK